MRSTLNNSYDLCEIIRSSRRVGGTTPKLDALQNALNSTKRNLQYTWDQFRSALGSRFELGDTIARSSFDNAIRNFQAIQSKLSSVAYGHERNGGFQTLLFQLQTLEAEVTTVFSSLKYRLEITPKEEKPKPILKKTRTDEATINIKKLDSYIEHLKNSWTEASLDGEIYYVNVFDETKKQWERPKNAFFKSLPKSEKPKRKPTWEKELEKERERQKEREREREKERERDERRRRADPWRHLDGW